MTKVLFCIFLFFSFSVVANAQTGKAPDKKRVVAGKILYKKYCIRCHRSNGVGERKPPKSLQRPGYIPAMPLNETSHAWHHTDEQIIHTIRNGTASTKRMPVFKSIISNNDAKDILAYIKSLWSPKIISCQGPRHMACGGMKMRR